MMLRTSLDKTLQRIWYGSSVWSLVLWPLSLLFGAIVAVRRWGYSKGLFATTKISVPVVVIGNLSVGGVGKTPLVLALAQLLLDRGIKPGIVSRGYGARVSNTTPRKVTGQSSSDEVGDEALLMYQRLQLPVYVCVDRVAAAKACAEVVDVVLCDDGLQHYKLARDLELVVIDGDRKLGNGRLLPAGPLREPKSRLDQVDYLVTHRVDCKENSNCMCLKGDELRSVDGEHAKKLHHISASTVHAVAGIGNPKRFFDALRRAGLKVIEHAFSDHHVFQRDDFAFTQPATVVMTEKDAVKCRGLGLKDSWYLKVDAQLSYDVISYFNQQIDQLLSDHVSQQTSIN